MALHYIYTLSLFIHTNDGASGNPVCFNRQLFANPVQLLRGTIGDMRTWGELIWLHLVKKSIPLFLNNMATSLFK